MAKPSGPGIAARLAAAFAIAGLLAAIAVGGFALTQGQPWRLVVALLGIAVSIVGAWYALSRRRAARLAGVIAAICGLAAFVAVIVTAEYRGALLAVALFLAAASSVSARYALGKKAEASTIAPRVVAFGGDRAVLLMNPKSGGGKVERYHLEEACRERGIEPVVLQGGDDLRQLAVEAIARGAGVIGMAGGDGSQALVASVAAQNDVPFVCIPAGTRNHLALDLGVDRNDVVGALDAFVEGVERRVDLATVNGRVFVNNASMGLYAKIVQSDAYRDAKLKTATDMLPDLIGPEAPPFDLRFAGPDGVLWPYAHMLLVSNNAYELDQLLGGGTRPRMDTGRLGVAAARIEGAGDAVSFVGLEAAGRIRRFRGWSEWETPTFTVESAGPIEVGIDGEALSLLPPLVFRSLPGALRVRLPKSARRARPAGESVHLAPATIASLFAVAAGRS